jgi:SNF2 family DNA or RNA helicase
MSHESRANSIKVFEKPEVRILLASLKCGGGKFSSYSAILTLQLTVSVGLNLTMAQNVISIDPWWNWAVEQQAFGRVVRLGQTREMAMTRFVVENTVDQRIIEMQERKGKQIDWVMDGRRKK